MTQIPDNFALNREKILLASRNGTVPGEGNSSAKSTHSLWSKAIDWFRRSRFPEKRKSRTTNTQAALLKQMNRVLVVFSIVLTISLPLFLWKDAAGVQEKMKLPGLTEVPANQQSLVKVNRKRQVSLAKLASQRQFFVNEGSESSSAESAPVNAMEVPGLSQRYSLLGVMMGETPKAIVRENISNNSMFVTVDDRLGGYLIKEILSDRIVLEQDGERFELTM